MPTADADLSLRERDKALQAGLANASMAAQSGELARLLASMSAAVSQQLVILSSETDALQTTLAAEHAAVYVYGVLGGRTSKPRAGDLRRDLLGVRRSPGSARPAHRRPA